MPIINAKRKWFLATGVVSIHAYLEKWENLILVWMSIQNGFNSRVIEDFQTYMHSMMINVKYLVNITLLITTISLHVAILSGLLLLSSHPRNRKEVAPTAMSRPTATRKKKIHIK